MIEKCANVVQNPILFAAGTKFGDAKSCSRLCDGKQRTCYYEFGVQVYDSMSGYAFLIDYFCLQYSKILLNKCIFN